MCVCVCVVGELSSAVRLCPASSPQMWHSSPTEQPGADHFSLSLSRFFSLAFLSFILPSFLSFLIFLCLVCHFFSLFLSFFSSFSSIALFFFFLSSILFLFLIFLCPLFSFFVLSSYSSYFLSFPFSLSFCLCSLHYYLFLPLFHFLNVFFLLFSFFSAVLLLCFYLFFLPHCILVCSVYFILHFFLSFPPCFFLSLFMPYSCAVNIGSWFWPPLGNPAFVSQSLGRAWAQGRWTLKPKDQSSRGTIA